MEKLSNYLKKVDIESSPPWTIVYERFIPADEYLREALCTLGNGYLGTRGVASEVTASKIHYPGTYISGLYNRLKTHIAGKVVINEDLVNCPNWVFLTFKIGEGNWFLPSKSRFFSYNQRLDMKRGLLTRKIRFQTQKKQKTYVETNRIVSMANPHYAALEYIITPENYSEQITVRTMLDGTVLNTGVERYRQLNSKHWKPSSLGSFDRNGIFLSMKTSQSHVEVSQASKIRIFAGNREIKPKIKHLMKGKERIGQEFKFFARAKQVYRIEKIVSIYTSKDQGVKNSTKSAKQALTKKARFKNLFKSHKKSWENLWHKFDIQIEGHIFSQRILRFHIFHLLQAASMHSTEIDSAIPARGLHGEAYRGHIFWDQLFALQLYDFHQPDISKSSLLYRFRRLPKAREYAKKEHYRGAMFPWQSGSSGREETQMVHLNPLSGKWGIDLSRRQRHVSIAISYNVWQYYKRTGDFAFLVRYGAEIILSIAQFWSSLVNYDSQDKRYHTKGIMGPDEFHEKLPNSPRPGLKDNAYINFMISWSLLKAQEVIKILPQGHKKRIMRKIKLDQKELSRWDDIIYKMKLIFNKEGIISQFDGYFGLKELDWEGYRAEYGDIHRLDRILKAEGKLSDSYKISKQADALMIFYLLPSWEIEDIFRRLNYEFNKDTLRNNYKYYIKRTSHGSTLSRVTHCFISGLLNRQDEAWQMFLDVLRSDIYDIQGGTTSEGIHTGVMGGSIDLVMRGFAGLCFKDDRICIDPKLPKAWKSLKFRFLYRGVWFYLVITKKQVLILIQGQTTIPIEIHGKLNYPLLGKALKVSLKK